MHQIKISKSLISLSCVLLATTIAVHEYAKDLDVENNVQIKLNEQTITVSENQADEVVAQAIEQEAVDGKRVITIGQGDTLTSVLLNLGLSKDQAHSAVESLKVVYNPKALKVGQELNVTFKPASDVEPLKLLGLDFKTAAGHTITLAAEKEQFVSTKQELQLKCVQRAVQGKISSSFYAAAVKQGVPAQIVKDAFSALSYDVNWQHDPQAGDEFQILYDVYEDLDGKVVKVGALKYAGFAPKGSWRRIYSFQTANGTSLFNEKGESVVRSLLQTPLDPTKMRVTSRFGRRNHPMLGYTKMHKGVDFGAPAGTPVMASGEGVVAKAGWNGAYGNYVMIRHNSDYSTAYAHLSKVNVKAGQKVKQREVIGAVGSTGRSTGPHLHYEVIHRGQHVNPQSIRQLPTTKLAGTDLARFQKVRAEYNEQLHIEAQQEFAAARVIAAG